MSYPRFDKHLSDDFKKGKAPDKAYWKAIVAVVDWYPALGTRPNLSRENLVVLQSVANDHLRDIFKDEEAKKAKLELEREKDDADRASE